MNVDALVVAVERYFRGERSEMLSILAFSLAAVLVAGALHAVTRDGFSRGFGIATLASALLLSATAASLLRRDPPHQARLVANVRGTDPGASVAAEASRMAEVIRKYPSYRRVALGLAVLALVGVAATRIGWVNGAAAGILVLVVAQTVVDHYSEARAIRYARELDAALARSR
jgi:hypothetical protein